MTRHLRVSLLSVNQTPLDWSGNLRRLGNGIKAARQEGAHVVLCPELCLTGYGCEDYFLNDAILHRAEQCLWELAALDPTTLVIAGLPFALEGKRYNALALLFDGRLLGLQFKSHLAKSGIHYEPRWFDPWPLGRKGWVSLRGRTIPCGSLMININGYQATMEICEDAWVDDALRPCLAFRGQVHGVFNASASHFSLGKSSERDRVILHTSELIQGDAFYANHLGCEAGRAIYDGELLAARQGTWLGRTERLGLTPWNHVTVEVPYKPKTNTCDLVLSIPDKERVPLPPCLKKRSFESKECAFPAAATLGLWDYLRKSGQEGFSLSLSGGVDSAVCAVLVAMMCQRVADERRQGRLSEHTFPLPHPLTGSLLHTIYQGSKHSSQRTHDAAAALANELGASHRVWSIQPLVDAYQNLVEQPLGRTLEWEQDDLALQNIQARTRAPGIWMWAGLHRHLLLTTSNRSEAAVGYATMDGDTAGSLAPIAGVEKTFLRYWLAWLCENASPFGGPFASLNAIVDQAPTAELRPLGQEQTDEADLMPYPVLDALEHAMVFERRSVKECHETIQDQFGHQYDASSLKQWTLNFIRLFSQNQWKRERIAPAFHLDDNSLDPKTWARFPILCSQFREERRQLEQS
jgi:NAD+ synthase (glutamine-hydrolysing)